MKRNAKTTNHAVASDDPISDVVNLNLLDSTLPDLDPDSLETFAAMNSSEVDGQIYLERLQVAVSGFAYFEFIYSACKLDLIGYLQKNGGTPLAKISRDLGIPEYSTRVMLMGCSYLGLVERNDDLYTSTPMAEPYARNHPKTMWPLLDGYHSIVYRPMHRLSESLKAATNVGLNEIPGSGRTLYDRLAEHPELEKIFHQWMYGLGRAAGLSNDVLELLRPTLEQVNDLVDYGGGDGSNAISICKYYPHIKVTLFDSSSVCGLAREKIKKANLENRIFLHEGNFLNDPFVQNVDAVMFNHINNIYSPETNTTMLSKSYKSLAENGVVILFNTVSYDLENGPACAPPLSAYFLALATGQGMVYPLKDYDRWLEAAGFRDVNKFHLTDIEHGLVIARK